MSGQPLRCAAVRRAAGHDPHGNVPAAPYAQWSKRVGAYLIDEIVISVAQTPLWIGYFMYVGDVAGNSSQDPLTGEISTAGGMSGPALVLILVGAVTGLLAYVWNTCLKGGGTGHTIGKGVLGITLVSEATGQPIGAGKEFLRSLARSLDSLPCYPGFLWPLWDARRQTFADKVMSTFVIDAPKP